MVAINMHATMQVKQIATIIIILYSYVRMYVPHQEFTANTYI